MTTYGGFDPGVFQPWALNLEQKSLGAAGIAHGLSVTPLTPASMNVNVNIDGTALDGVAFLSNGAWFRIDAQVSLGVPANTSGVSRTDAVLAYVDPTGITTPQLVYTPTWTGGFAGNQGGNALVLALVTVPNGASSIVASNIVPTPLVANIGGSPLNVADSVVEDETPGDAGQVGVYSAHDVVITTNAALNQTTFGVPLTSFQRLVPMGRIGGAIELGFFASPNGWYTPRVVGSVSGNLPVASVDWVAGNIVTALGAQSGEQVMVSFKFYDFSRDLKVWGGMELLEANSPYIVYQGDVLPGQAYLSDDTWAGSRGGVLLPLNTNIICTFLGQGAIAQILGLGGTGVGYQTAIDSLTLGGLQLMTLPAEVGNIGFAANIESANFGIHAALLYLGQGDSELGGFLVYNGNPNTYFVDGGQAVVDGFPVAIANSSVTVTPAAGAAQMGTIYLDRFGNLTASAVTLTPPFAERHGGRIPVLQALQYGFNINAIAAPYSTAWGAYALPGNNPVGTPAYIALHNTNFIAEYNSNTQSASWLLATNPTSPYGGYATSTSTFDTFLVGAWCSGMDVLMEATTTAAFTVTVRDFTSFNVVQSGPPTTDSRVRLTLFTSAPLSYYVVTLTSQTSNRNFGIEAVDLRVPQYPAIPQGTLPLGVYFIGSSSSFMRWPASHFATSAAPAATTKLLADVVKRLPGPTVGLVGTSINQNFGNIVPGATAFRAAYAASQGQGKVNVTLNGVTSPVTIDAYAPIGGTAWTVTAWIALASAGAYQFAYNGTNTKNTSATGVFFDGALFDTMLPLVVTDLRKFPADGRYPTDKGSGLLSFKGDALPDAGYGIQTPHVADRAITSRKVAPSWSQVLSSTAWSNNGVLQVDPFLTTTITVDVPSLLLINVNVVAFANPGQGVWVYINVDGHHAITTNTVNAPGMQYFDNLAGSAAHIAFAPSAIVPVGPGTHVIGYSLGGGISTIPSNATRSLSVVAFAL